jgi:LacI family transcriptional regulator
MNRVTIHAVAEAAGVSIGSVSNVFNNHNDRVAATTRETVRRVAAELGYRPNRIAQSLVTRRTATIGLIVSEITNPLYPPAIEGVEQQAKTLGWHVILSTADDVPAQIEAAELLLDRNVDGLIVFATSQLADDRYLSDLAADGIPVVTINRVIDDPRIGQVRFDNRGGAATVVEHLINLGHTRIAHIAGPSMRLNARLRLEGYRAMLDHYQLPIHEGYVREGDYSFGSGVLLTQALLACRPTPTAIFAASGEVALGALHVLYAAGLRVPEDMSLVTFGNPEFLSYCTPTITTVNLPVVEAGARAAQLVIDRIDARQDTVPPPITLPAELVLGASTAPPPQERVQTPCAQGATR